MLSGRDAASLGSELAQSIPEGMTEDQAMDIWLRRNGELEEERLRALRHHLQDTEEDAAAPPREVGGRPQRSPSPMSDDDPHEFTPSVADPRQSDAWNAALARNPLGAYDPANHDAWMCMQRYELATRPEVVDNYVPSTPGMALLMEYARREDRRNAEREAAGRNHGGNGNESSSDDAGSSGYGSRNQLDMPVGSDWRRRASSATAATSVAVASHHNNNTSAEARSARRTSTDESTLQDAIAAQRQALAAHRPSPGPPPPPQEDAPRDPRIPADYVPRHDYARRNYHTGGAPARREEVLAAQRREYERLSGAHRKRPPPAADAGRAPGQGASKKGAAGADGTCGYRVEKRGNHNNSFHLATRTPTGHNSKAVTCCYCQRGLHTAPLAQFFYCQACCRVSQLSEREADIETRWEEKMQEAEEGGREGMDCRW